MWANLGIRKKMLLLFFLISTVPLVAINLIWLRSSQDQLEAAAANRQSILLSSMVQRINDALDIKINSVVTASQDASITNLVIDTSKVRLLQFAGQDDDIIRVSLVDNEGDEKVVIEEGSLVDELKNIRASEEFRVVTFVSNEPYLGGVNRTGGLPIIKISVPLLSLGELGDQDLTSSQSLSRRFGGDISGALIVDVDLTKIWSSVADVQLGDDGYAYLVDRFGNLLVHPDDSFMDNHDSLQEVDEVKEALEVLQSFNLNSVAASFEPTPTVTTSEAGVTVLSSSYPIAQTQWALIGQEPVSSVYRVVNRATAIASLIFIISVPLAMGLVLLATRTIISPVHQLTRGVLRLSAGDFSGHFKVKGKDEISLLAQTFNSMGDNLRSLLERLNKKNIDLESEQTKLQAVLDTIADGVLVLDQNFSIVLANKTVASFVDQADPKALYGINWLEAFSLYYEEDDFRNELLNGELLRFSDVTMRVDDQQKFMDITALHLQNDPNGIAFILTIQDTTQRRELENMKLDFVSMAAHELRTPLTAISGYLNLISSSEMSPDEYRSFVKLASTNANMLEGLINNMLSLSRIERGVLVLNRTKLDWSKVIADEVKSLSITATEKQIDISLDMPEDDLHVWGDEVALREVLGNLINNAIHYSDEGKPIVVRAKIEGENVLTTVSDKGIGVPDKLHDKLFNKYYRAKGGLTTNSQGTGIGLFISKSIVEAHEGTIGFDSVFGQGSDFHFSIAAYNKDKHRQDDGDNDNISLRGKVDWFKKNTDS